MMTVLDPKLRVEMRHVSDAKLTVNPEASLQ